MNQSANLLQRYHALPDGCFRLLSLQPSAKCDAQVECHLLPARIDERPYEALSYVWGPEAPVHGIIVDAEEVHVRSNLYGALKELRLTDQPRILWVDSISINQSDIAERNHQVRQMGAIYSSATQVIVWLGEGDEDTDAAIDFVQGLSTLDRSTAKRIAEGDDLPWEHRKRVFSALGMKHGHDNHDRILGGLTKLMDHVWWKRVWTVQEIVLARFASLRCGTKSASWIHFCQLAAFAFEVSHHNTLGLGRPMDEAVFDEMTGAVSPLYVAVSTLSDLSYRLANGLVINLEQIVQQLRIRQATDPLDVIFGLLGLTTEKNIIEIDYGQSKKQIYKSAMKAMLQGNIVGRFPLHLLQDCYLERDPSLPSWVADFGILHSFKAITLASTGIGTGLTFGSLYNASLGDFGGNKPEFLDDDNVLELEGVLVDEEEEYIGGGSAIEAFWRTVSFDLLLTDRDYLAGNPDRRDRRLPSRAAGMPPTTTEEEAEIRDGIVDAPPPKTALQKLGERRFFITKTGYFGLGPASMQAGDKVCLLRGGFYPTVIRTATNDRYTMIGECYVHGIMDGEMIDSIKKGQSSWQHVSFV